MEILFLICFGSRPDMMDGLLLWMLTGPFFFLLLFDYLNTPFAVEWLYGS